MMQLDVVILTPAKVIFEGKAANAILPGEAGVFEILPFHKPMLTRLISGTLVVNDKTLPIRRGVAKVSRNKLTVIVEEAR